MAKKKKGNSNDTATGCGCLLVLVLAICISAFTKGETGLGVFCIVVFVLVILSAIVTLSDNSHNGLKRIRNTKKSYPNVDLMTGIQFEEYCGNLLLNNGYSKVFLTQASNDYGADIIAYTKKNAKIVIQCKRYNNSVGNSAVQEVVAAKAHYGASAAGIMTNSVLTQNARKLAKENGVIVYERIR